MKKILLLTSAVSILAAASLCGQIIASFEETGTAGNLAGAYPIDFINDSITGITLTADSNLNTAILALGSGATAGTATGSLGFASLTTPTLSDAISGAVYQSFTLTPSTGFLLNISGVTFNADASSATSTFNFNLLSSLTGFTTLDSLGSFSIVNGANVTTTIDTSGFNELQGVTSSVEFRIYANRSAGTGLVAYFADDGVNGGLFSFNGNVAAVPEPSAYAMLALAGAGFAGYVIRRRRR